MNVEPSPTQKNCRLGSKAFARQLFRLKKLPWKGKLEFCETEKMLVTGVFCFPPLSKGLFIRVVKNQLNKLYHAPAFSNFPTMFSNLPVPTMSSYLSKKKKCYQI